MPAFKSWIYPDLPPEIKKILFQDEKKLVIVGVIGKSAFPDCNKMTGLDVFDEYPSLLRHQCQEGQITFYYSKSEPILFLHFETTYDEYCMRREMFKLMESDEPGQSLLFNKYVRNRFARMFLFATQVCNIIIFVELSVTFDTSLISLFKSLKIIREKYVMKFVPKLLRNVPADSNLTKSGRMCSPRILFYFENYPDSYDKSEETVLKLESETDENIYKMLRNEQIIPNKSGTPFFSFPTKKKCVCFNTATNLREDPLLKSLNELQLLFKTNNSKDVDMDGLEELRPYGGFGKPSIQSGDIKITEPEKNAFMTFLKDHVNEILQFGMEDSVAKYKCKSIPNSTVPDVKNWYETFEEFHKIFVEDPDDPELEPTDPIYKAYLENFAKLMDIDDGFFAKCCNIGVKKACNLYNNPVLTHYGKSYHKTLVDEALAVYMSYARGPSISVNEEKLREIYEHHWPNEKQQQNDILNCRVTTSAMVKASSKENSVDSNEPVFTSCCNCGRTQGGREDSFATRPDNYELNRVPPETCAFCLKNKKSE